MTRARLRHTALALALVAGVGGAAVVPAAASAPAPTGVRAAAEPLPGEWWRSAMGVDELNRAGSGTGVTVAVIDGPIDPDVPELKGKVVSSRSYCETPGGATGRLLSPSAKGKDAEHATSMAALIAGSGRGTGSGGRGIRGIAPDVRIRHYAVLYAGEDGKKQCVMRKAGGDNIDQAVADAIAQAAEDGADVINISLVVGFDEDMVDALLTAYGRDAVVVAGSPNTRTDVQWPGLGNGVLLVNSVDSAGRIPDFAVRDSPFVALAAPGKDVMAASYDGSGWKSETLVSGSSIATALVSGGIAAIRSAYPEATSGQVLHAVKDNVGLREKTSGSGYETWFRRSGTDLPEVKSANTAYGWGIFDPADAVKVDPTTLPKDNPFVRTRTSDDPTAEQVSAALGTASPSATAAPTASASAPSSPSAQAAAPARTEDGSSTPWLPIGAGVLVLVLLAAGGAFVLGRRGSNPVPATPSGTPGPHDPTDSTQTTTTTDGATSAEGRKH
ncbi:S8 family peptidase [Phycicoccus avicenniae]|uniref:S8 family peptidase n=1 Tax=Phycicoccus avicenniae TaxID=2828860 RepID=UPI003D2962BC